MIYKLGEVPGDVIDRWRTGNYGEDYFKEYNEEDYVGECSNCHYTIYESDVYYDVDGTWYCMDCKDEAREAIIELVEDDYIVNGWVQHE